MTTVELEQGASAEDGMEEEPTSKKNEEQQQQQENKKGNCVTPNFKKNLIWDNTITANGLNKVLTDVIELVEEVQNNGNWSFYY